MWRQSGGAETPVLERPGAEVLAHHVGGGREAAEEILSLFRAQIAGDAFASTALDGPEQGVPVGEGSDGAHEVAGTRLLDLDHLGPPFAEEPGTERGTDAGADVDDSQSVEGTGHGWRSVPGCRGGVAPVPCCEDLLHRTHLFALIESLERRGGVVRPVVRHEVVLP